MLVPLNVSLNRVQPHFGSKGEHAQPIRGKHALVVDGPRQRENALAIQYQGAGVVTNSLLLRRQARKGTQQAKEKEPHYFCTTWVGCPN